MTAKDNAEAADDATELVSLRAELQSAKSAAAEWERLRNDAYRSFRAASDRLEEATGLLENVNQGQDWYRRRDAFLSGAPAREAKPDQFVEYAASAMHDYSVAYQRAESAESTLAAVNAIITDTEGGRGGDTVALVRGRQSKAYTRIRALLRTPAPATGERPKLDGCVQGHHSFSWRQRIEACRYCGEPVATGEKEGTDG